LEVQEEEVVVKEKEKEGEGSHKAPEKKLPLDDVMEPLERKTCTLRSLT